MSGAGGRVAESRGEAMTALVWTAPLQAEIVELPAPAPDGDHVVLDVRAAGVCGSDLHGYRGHSPGRVPPLILGHEVVGEDAGGEAYIVNPLVGCGSCALCAAGTPNLCPRRGLLGLDRPGAFAERVRVPLSSLHPLPHGMSPVVGSLVEPLATGVNAVSGASLEPGSVVAVLGCGAIGVLAAWAARQSGAGFVACHDIDAPRTRHARAVADIADTSLDAVTDAVRDAGDGLGAALVIDAVGVEATWRAAVALARPGGMVAAVGLGQADGGMPVGDLVRRGVTVRGVYAYTPDDFADALVMLRDAPPPLDWVETVPLRDGPAVLERLAAGRGPLKAVFLP